MSKTLKMMVDALPGGHSALPAELADVEIAGVIDDNRKVQPGFLFVAYPGVAVDGHKFIPDAVRRGAVAVVCEKPQPGLAVPHVVVPNARQALAHLCAAWYDFPGRDLVMVGVTGTDGKTSTTNLIYSILKVAGLNAGMISTVNAVIGERTLDTGLHTTTPDADEVQGYLAQMRAAGMTHCVLEVTSHSLAQYRVDGCDFDVAVVTNITHEHLDLHGSYEAYRAAKGRLFEMVGAQTTDPSASSGQAGRRTTKAITRTAVLNADDSFSFDYLRGISAPRQIVYSREHVEVGQAVSLSESHHTPDGMHLRVSTPRGGLALQSPLIGDFNISNILAAVSTAIALDIPDEAICAGVAAMRGVPGRMERIAAGQPFTAIVDFAHTPNALEQCLRTLRPITPGRLIVVFGCAGERDVQKRPMMGRVAAQWADRVILTAEDPRREILDTIIDQIEAGMEAPRPGQVLRVPDRGEAIRAACAMAEAGDTVVACGKGHEQSMCFGTTETPWDDRVAMRNALRDKA